MSERKIMPSSAIGQKKQILFNQNRLSVQNAGAALPLIRQEDLRLAVTREAKELPVLRKMTVADREPQDLLRQKRGIHTPGMLLRFWQLPVCTKNPLRDPLQIRSGQIKQVPIPFRIL